MKIAIRADGGKNIGFGHIMRTLVLAKELKKNNEVFYICRKEAFSTGKYEDGIKKILQEGFLVEFINENKIIEGLSKIKSDCLITDSYDVNETYFNETAKYFKKTGYIDDMALYNFNVDFIINQNVNAEELSYKTSQNTKLLLGSQYIMLREEFYPLTEKVSKDKVENIMITVGGADLYGISSELLKYISGLECQLHIVIGPSFDENSIRSIEKFNKKNIHFSYNTDMPSLMKRCDLAISACGSTLYEFAFCGVPILGIILADNQEGMALKMEQLGIIKILGWHYDLAKKDILALIYEVMKDAALRYKMSITGQRVIDGKGSYRIAKYINNL